MIESCVYFVIIQSIILIIVNSILNDLFLLVKFFGSFSQVRDRLPPVMIYIGWYEETFSKRWNRRGLGGGGCVSEYWIVDNFRNGLRSKYNWFFTLFYHSRMCYLFGKIIMSVKSCLYESFELFLAKYFVTTYTPPKLSICTSEISHNVENWFWDTLQDYQNSK